MKDNFFNKKVDYFWEYKFPFGEYFLKNIFKEEYKRKYSLTGEGIYDLLFIDNKIYELSFKETKKMMDADGKTALRDDIKNNIVNLISKELENNDINYTINSGKYITFKIGEYIAKIEIIKKVKEPQ